jgi:hypothetical protein
LKIPDKSVVYELTTSKSMSDSTCLHQDEIMAALKSIQGSTIFTTATKSKKMMSDFNFNPIPSEIKYHRMSF